MEFIKRYFCKFKFLKKEVTTESNIVKFFMERIKLFKNHRYTVKYKVK